MKKLTMALLAVPLIALSGAAFAGDAAVGKDKSEALGCMDCHAGEDFEGMTLEEIIEANKAVLSGAQRHPPGLDDMKEADIADISAYFYAEAGGQ